MLKTFFDEELIYNILDRTRTNILDFSKYIEYGKVNSYAYYIPNTNNISQIPSFKEFYAIRKVSESFEALLENINHSSYIGNIDKSSLFHVNNIQVKKSYTSPYSQYFNYLYHLFKLYMYLGKDDATCSGMINNFLNYVKHNNIKFTIYHALETGICDIFTTGLAIKYTEDSVEKRQMYEDQYFSYFCNLCNKYNFYLHKNKPNILVYKLESDYDFSDYTPADDEKLFTFYKQFFQKCWDVYRQIHRNRIDVRSSQFEIDNSSFFKFLTDRRLFEKNFPVEGMLPDIIDVQQKLGYAESMRILNSSALKDETVSPIPEAIFM
jgi:hypothetical protein